MAEPSGDRFVQLIELNARRQLQHGELLAEDEIVVSSGPAIAHLAAAQAPVHDYLFPIPFERRANRLHQAAALVLSVARRVIDMPRIEAERAMVALPAATDRRPDEGLAMPAFELFQLGLPP